MNDEQLQEFSENMLAHMVASLRVLPLDRLIVAHDAMVDKYEEAAGSKDEAAAEFALTALGEAIRQKQIARAMN